jgi:hypothetical protein
MQLEGDWLGSLGSGGVSAEAWLREAAPAITARLAQPG